MPTHGAHSWETANVIVLGRRAHPSLSSGNTHKTFQDKSHQGVRGTFHISRVCHLKQFCPMVGRCISISARGCQKNRYLDFLSFLSLIFPLGFTLAQANQKCGSGEPVYAIHVSHFSGHEAGWKKKNASGGANRRYLVHTA